ncbi:pseudouridine-5'-phosphate glycosidase [Saccharopolyspora shandongensis]|uniref:Pseudouridine-5'-phosphate glycosidase n=1 Tax=Saccharopolyspora shandongensis TaxID=418495 RepID=A0A1H2UQ98_9PSEU|nr:pseudouridine-5'-phosphate glycosidase [Saccharopolyspora shandongensis]SDW58303.1 pseudouridine-5'-phosphate glycosidase [Saccharopolyspora shandongensis]
MSLPVVSDEVRRAVAEGRPVVALESTIITHGLPRPDNGEVARAAERQIRAAGAVPATIGVVDGVATVGLTGAQLDRLADDRAAAKASVRDLPVAAAKRRNAGTTVAATSFLAHRAGIRVFATGGLGGVHHGAATSFDESADLVTLAATPLVVVSAGVKSILDVAATLERLETLNIPVLGYRTSRFPGFYVADSGHEIEYSADTPEEVAAAVAARDELGLRSAVLVANPVPADEQLDPALHDRALAEAWEEARRQGVGGHDITPFLLDRIRSATGGRSLAVNIAVYRNNIELATAIAIALAEAA